MAAEIKETFDIESELIKSSGGVFDVKCDDKLVYSKKQNGDKFPEHGEVLDSIRSLTSEG